MPPTLYERLIERVFLDRYHEGDAEVAFDRADIGSAARELSIEPPSNIGDVVYSFRYRSALPQSIREKAPPGLEWIIRPAGRSRYVFVATSLSNILPTRMLAETKVPDATPGIIAMYALTDEQALLARLRYNRLVDIFTGVACYSLQSHLRTAIPRVGQIETDELYIGVDRRGVHYVLPVQAKGGNDTLSVVQIEQDFALCAHRFPDLVCRPIGAQFMDDNVIALFEFEKTDDSVAIAAEKHYRLVLPDDVTSADLDTYRRRND